MLITPAVLSMLGKSPVRIASTGFLLRSSTTRICTPYQISASTADATSIGSLAILIIAIGAAWLRTASRKTRGFPVEPRPYWKTNTLLCRDCPFSGCRQLMIAPVRGWIPFQKSNRTSRNPK
jgi:hypothetical protein